MSGFECLVFDPLLCQHDGLTTIEVDVGSCQVGDALVVAQMILVTDEVSNLLFEITGQMIVFEQDVAFQRLIPALNLAQVWGVHRGAANMTPVYVFQPACQVGRDVAGTVVAEQSWLMKYPGTVTA